MSRDDATKKLVAMCGMSRRDAAKMLDASTPEEINTLAAVDSGDAMRQAMDCWADNHTPKPPVELPAKTEEEPTD